MLNSHLSTPTQKATHQYSIQNTSSAIQDTQNRNQKCTISLKYKSLEDKGWQWNVPIQNAYLYEDYVDSEEVCKEIWSHLVEEDWICLRHRRVQVFGGIVKDGPFYPEVLPNWLACLTRDLQQYFPNDFPINHVLVNGTY